MPTLESWGRKYSMCLLTTGFQHSSTQDTGVWQELKECGTQSKLSEGATRDCPFLGITTTGLGVGEQGINKKKRESGSRF